MGGSSLPSMGLLPRRALLAGTAALAATACTPSEDPTAPSLSPSPSPTPTAGPFGLAVPSTIRVTVHEGPFGTSIVDGAAARLRENFPGVEVQVEAVVSVADEVGPTLSTMPPDLVNNSGDGRLALGTIADELTPLDELLESPNLAGTPIRDTLYTGALSPGIVDDQQLAMQYTLIVHGLWYSETLFSGHGWSPPNTWDDLYELGAAAAETGRTLFAWDPTQAGEYLDLVIASAIKEDGHDLRLELDNLAPDAWRNPAIERILGQLRRLVQSDQLAEYPDGARERWASGGPLLCPAGATLLRQTKPTMRPDFMPTVAPVPTITRAPKLPFAAIHSEADESFFVPRNADNPQGGMELLRTLLSPEIAAEFSELNELPTVIRGATPESPALASQVRLLADAGENTFKWLFIKYYGLGEQSTAAMAEFLRGELDPGELIDRLQTMCDEVREDPDVVKYEVE